MGQSSVSPKPISHSPDLRRLREEGYDIDVRSAYLIMRDVPYVNARQKVKLGILVSTLRLAGDVTQQPDTHVVTFAGEYPYHADGTQMTEMVIGSAVTKLDEGLIVDHTFSQKPKRGHYLDYYEKMTTYAAILGGQARVIDPKATAQSFRVDEPEEDDSPFNYLDTASSRAEINTVTRKLRLDNVAIVGLGGTGAYVLDNVTKTPVRKIHTFDGDKLSTHNAFRSSGAASIEELRQQPLKTSYFKQRYEKMHRGIVEHAYYINESNVAELRGMAFVFLCIDRAPDKQAIIARLLEWGIPFVDVGMGVYVRDGMLGGSLRVTLATRAMNSHLPRRISVGAGGNNEYDTNIQIADLNMLNAALAVMKWKKHFGFYADLEREHFSAYTIETNLLVSEDML